MSFDRFNLTRLFSIGFDRGIADCGRLVSLHVLSVVIVVFILTLPLDNFSFSLRIDFTFIGIVGEIDLRDCSLNPIEVDGRFCFEKVTFRLFSFFVIALEINIMIWLDVIVKIERSQNLGLRSPSKFHWQLKKLLAL